MSGLELRGDTRLVGVFGYPVEHSLSPAMHNSAFAALRLPFVYVPFLVRPERLGEALRALPALGIVGVNLTIPHKERALPFLDSITDGARDVGAVNTVHCCEAGLLGDNTDGWGFYEPLRVMGHAVAGTEVVVVGAGGAARAVVFRLAREGARITLTNRTRERAERLAADVEAAGFAKVHIVPMDDTDVVGRVIAGSHLLVQTTRVGMYPDTAALPTIPVVALHRDLLVYDLVYNPVETQLLREARERGCRTLSGVKMLVYQGAAAFQLWTGVWPSIDVMERAVLGGLDARR